MNMTLFWKISLYFPWDVFPKEAYGMEKFGWCVSFISVAWVYPIIIAQSGKLHGINVLMDATSDGNLTAT